MTPSPNAYLNSGFPQAHSLLADASPSETTPLRCTLRWRQGKLWVNRADESSRLTTLPALASLTWFRRCLARSQTEAVCIDPALGSEVIWLWTQACHEAGKPLYLRLPKYPKLPQQKGWPWRVKRLLDHGVAALLLLLLSPLLLLLTGLIWLDDGWPIVSYHWRVGERGRLFRAWKFRSERLEAPDQLRADGIKPTARPLTATGGWLRRTHLDLLPRLFNVVRGDISLIGPHPWAIYESVHLPVPLRARLNLLPGITGTLSTFAHQRVDEIDFAQLAQHDLERLGRWSLGQDLAALGQTMGQVLKRYKGWQTGSS